MTDGKVAHLPDPEYIDDGYVGAGKLKDKRILISGGDSGIGRAVSLHFAREGAKVAFIYHAAEDKAEDTRKGIEAEGAEALVIQGDTASSADCDAAVQKVIDAWGGIDVLVNNAGFQKPYKTLEDVSDEDWRAHFDVNMAGMFFLSRAALRHMTEGANIVNTTSINAFVGNDALVPYSATKGAITAFTRSLAKQYMDRGIRVNEVAPGPVATDIQSVFEDFDEDILKNMAAPMGRVGQPRELGPAYVFLASRDGSFVTGQTIHVNGGMIVGA
ncbi:NAD(P)-dependent dehydrogenase (short-subunit alcohol dehydrogenase family) [Sagittula marina]|uniref:NAD(P)-dependent dehydrogenase (Short-subunit alcohol dehydrogenase family) n=1 Tax=Sagittula marina TaxID=943940 RepID=A0A7W6GTB1_9RHOB|nr:SDR family oxidoreductase [Sagittula marina]MBB3985009.1 NAD(P)-dependent dehydrogenase (short-subunit alcohol dehydrogenase family) [Sagittula marina]